MYRIRVRCSRRAALLLALACLLAPMEVAAQVTIFYPPPHSSTDTRNQYPIRLLETALHACSMSITTTRSARPG